jgi:hypothetical protein
MEAKDEALLILSCALLVTGGLSLIAARGRWLERAGERKWLAPLLAPYRLMGLKRVGGGVQRYLRVTGWFLLVAGVLVAVGVLTG